MNIPQSFKNKTVGWALSQLEKKFLKAIESCAPSSEKEWMWAELDPQATVDFGLFMIDFMDYLNAFNESDKQKILDVNFTKGAKLKFFLWCLSSNELNRFYHPHVPHPTQLISNNNNPAVFLLNPGKRCIANHLPKEAQAEHIDNIEKILEPYLNAAKQHLNAWSMQEMLIVFENINRLIQGIKTENYSNYDEKMKEICNNVKPLGEKHPLYSVVFKQPKLEDYVDEEPTSNLVLDKHNGRP